MRRSNEPNTQLLQDFNPRTHEGCDSGKVCKTPSFCILFRYFFIVNDYDFHLDEKYT